MGISIWLMLPTNGREYSELKDIISRISDHHSSPPFAPHITFASFPDSFDIPRLDSALRTINEGLLGKRLDVASIKRGATYFQSVFLALSTPSSEGLVVIRNRLYSLLDVEAQQLPEFAHLSLFYGDDEDEKTLVLADLKNKYVAPFVFETSGATSLETGGVWIVRCVGAVEEWEVLRKY